MSSKTVRLHAARWMVAMTILCCHVVSTQSASVESPRELQTMVLTGIVHNPRVTAAREVLRSAAAVHKGRHGFYDARLVSSVGYRDTLASIPGASGAPGIENDTLTASLSVRKAVRSGAYLAVGAEERYLANPGDPYSRLYQTTVGARLTIPIARDCRFAIWAAGTDSTHQTMLAVSNDMVAIVQAVRHDIELAYVSALQALAAEGLARQAADRVTALLHETEQRVRLKAIPEYQLYAARLEVSLSDEDIRRAEQAGILQRIRLAQLMGQTKPVNLAADSEKLLSLVSTTGDVIVATCEDACLRRGLYLAAQRRVEAAKANLRQSRERLKPDITVHVAATWQAEDPDLVVGTDAILADKTTGAEVAMVWKQPLGRRTERAGVRSREALLRAREENLASIRLQIAGELMAARTSMAATTDRLALARAAVSEAVRTLVAEEERFGLGEGRSRNVLDAQKDLTAALSRRNSAATGLLKATADFRYAAGLGISIERTKRKQRSKE